MNNPSFGQEEFGSENRAERGERERADNKFKKLKRPLHASKRSKTPERLHGIHRRRRRRLEW
jgi:hypothetical protein